MAPVAPPNRGGGGNVMGMLQLFGYVIVLSLMGFYYFTDVGNVKLPRPQGRYYFDTPETQLVLAEAAKVAAQQQRLITAASAALLALQSSVSATNASDSSPDDGASSPSAAQSLVSIRDNAELWKLMLTSSVNASDFSFAIDEAGTRAHVSDYHVRALTAYKLALRAHTEEEADLAEMIDYVQLFMQIWKSLFSDMFHEEGSLRFLSQREVDAEWLSEWSEEYMRPSERREHEAARAAAEAERRRAHEGPTSTRDAGEQAIPMTLNRRLVEWLRTHPATSAQAENMRRFLLAQTKLWVRRDRIRAQQASSYAARAGKSRRDTAHLDNADEDEAIAMALFNTFSTLTAAEWHAREEAAKVGVHVFLAADNGTYSGLHELHFVQAAMRFVTDLDVGPDCQSAKFGFLERPRRDPLTLRVLDPAKDAHAIQYVPALAVTTGIYVSRSAVCTAAIAALPMFTIKSMTFMGTAGVSPVVELGGWSPLATAADLYASDRTRAPSTTTTTTTKVAANHANGDAAWSTVATSSDANHSALGHSGAWTRAQLEAGVNPVCQSEWNLAIATQEGRDGASTAVDKTMASSPLLSRLPPSARSKTPREVRERKVSIGSVCVTSSALLQECGLCVEENPRPSLCSRPHCSIHGSTTFFGPCDFAQRAVAGGGGGYAENLKGAMYFQDFPPVPPLVQAGMTMFWAAQESIVEYERVASNAMSSTDESSGVQNSAGRRARSTEQRKQEEAHEGEDVFYRYNRAPPESPIVLNCAEVDTSQILAGVRSDILCREYARALLFPVSSAPTERVAQELREMRAKVPLTCVQAMEGLGFLSVMTRQYPHVPVAIVRGASNYDTYPLTREVYTEREDDAAQEEEKAEESGQEGKTRQAARRTWREPMFQTRAEKQRALQRRQGARGDGASTAQSGSHSGSSESNTVGAATQDHAAAPSSTGLQTMTRRERRQRGARGRVRRGGGGGDHAANAAPETLVRWVQNEHFMSPREYDDYVRASYRYAIETASSVVLNFFLKENTVLPGENV